MTYKLTNGAKVQIITAKSGKPSRDWLIPQLGYLATSRARAKARTWFRNSSAERDQSIIPSLFFNRRAGVAKVES